MNLKYTHGNRMRIYIRSSIIVMPSPASARVNWTASSETIVCFARIIYVWTPFFNGVTAFIERKFNLMRLP
jgi:hypothetical protein